MYRFVACWLFGFGAVGFYYLLTPFISGIWLRKDGWALSQTVVFLLVAEFYLKGCRIVLLNFKIAAGLFEQDRFLPLAQGAVNLVVSILLVMKIGVTGVYVGTVVSGLMANLIRPGIIYRVCFDRKPWDYFKDSVKYIGVILAAGVAVTPLYHVIMTEVSILSVVLTAVVITLLYNLAFLAVFHRREEFVYLWNAVVVRIPAFGRLFRRKQSQGKGSRKGDVDE